MALADIADLARHPTMVRRVTAAAVKSAVSIGNEEHDDSRYRNRRSALATMVLRHAEIWGEVFSWAVAAHPLITVDSPDTHIDEAVDNVWDLLAGAYQAPQAAQSA